MKTLRPALDFNAPFTLFFSALDFRACLEFLPSGLNREDSQMPVDEGFQWHGTTRSAKPEYFALRWFRPCSSRVDSERGHVAFNGGPTHPSELVEFTKSGKFVREFNVDAGQGGAFGIGTVLSGFPPFNFAEGAVGAI
jgi:hypothetical protein